MYDLTIAIPSYNGKQTIKKAIDSAINQKKDGIKIQVLISDDNSSDGTKEIINKYSEYDDVKININDINPEPEYGAVSNFNTCLKKADGKYFMILCQDDFISNNYAATLINKLEKNDDSIFIGACIGKNEFNEIIHKSYRKSIELSGIEALKSIIYGKKETKRHAWVMFATKTADLIKAGGFPNTSKAQMSDQIFLYRILLDKKLIYSNESQYYYLIHRNSFGNSDTKYIGKSFEDSMIYWNKEIAPILKKIISNQEYDFIVKKMINSNARLFILRVFLYGGSLLQKIVLIARFEKKSWILKILFDLNSYKNLLKRLKGV
jgi:glycosyltransferase involved in cell wall biosynthesis